MLMTSQLLKAMLLFIVNYFDITLQTFIKETRKAVPRKNKKKKKNKKNIEERKMVVTQDFVAMDNFIYI